MTVSVLIDFLGNHDCENIYISFLWIISDFEVDLFRILKKIIKAAILIEGCQKLWPSKFSLFFSLLNLNLTIYGFLSSSMILL